MVAPPALTRIELGAAVDIYLDRVAGQVRMGSKTAATHRNYAADLHDLVTILGADMIADDITGEDIDTALDRYAALPDRRRTGDSPGPPRAAGTKVRFWQSVHQFFEDATLRGFVQVSPTRFVSMKPLPPQKGTLRKERTSLSGDQAWALLEYGAGPQHQSGRSHEMNWARDRLILSLLVITGARVSELCAARNQDFEPDRGNVMWRIVGKGGHVRAVPLSPWLVDRLRAYQATRPPPLQGHDPLLLTGRGTPLAPRDVQRLMRRAYERVLTAAPGLAREVTPHALRHSAATLLVASGWDVKVVAELLGHGSIATTGKYLDPLAGELAKAIASHPAANPLRP